MLCEAPNCGAEIPLMRSFWFCKKTKRKRALRHRVEISSGPASPRVEFEVFEPKADKDVHAATVTNRQGDVSLLRSSVAAASGSGLSSDAQKGGADVVFDNQGRRMGGARMTAVVTLRPGRERTPLPPADGRGLRGRCARPKSGWHGILGEWERGGRQGLCPVPDESTPAGGGSGAGRAFGVQRYGMLQWGDLFTARQKAALMACWPSYGHA